MPMTIRITDKKAAGAKFSWASLQENLCWLGVMVVTMVAALVAPILVLVYQFNTLGLASLGLSVGITIVALYIIVRRIQEIRVTRKYANLDNTVK